jgi:hypothetical protein
MFEDTKIMTDEDFENWIWIEEKNGHAFPQYKRISVEDCVSNNIIPKSLFKDVKTLSDLVDELNEENEVLHEENKKLHMKSLDIEEKLTESEAKFEQFVSLTVESLKTLGFTETYFNELFDKMKKNKNK